jgi:hypothetical protein
MLEVHDSQCGFLKTLINRFFLQLLTLTSISAEFVLQLIKMSSKQCRSCTTERNGPGGI